MFRPIPIGGNRPIHCLVFFFIFPLYRVDSIQALYGQNIFGHSKGMDRRNDLLHGDNHGKGNLCEKDILRGVSEMKVVVVGGGWSWCAAPLSARKQGIEVTLPDRSPVGEQKPRSGEDRTRAGEPIIRSGLPEECGVPEGPPSINQDLIRRSIVLGVEFEIRLGMFARRALGGCFHRFHNSAAVPAFP
jgi:hypothetical protein